MQDKYKNYYIIFILSIHKEFVIDFNVNNIV